MKRGRGPATVIGLFGLKPDTGISTMNHQTYGRYVQAMSWQGIF